MQENHVLDGKQVECKRAVPMGYLDKTPGMVGRVPAGSSQTSGGGGYGGPQSVQGGSGGGVGIHARYNPEKIFVGGLPISCDDAKLREYFSKYGVIVDAVVMIDRDLQRHRGFGYVLFQDAASVDATVNEHESHQIDGKWVDVKRCVVQENASWPPQSGPMRKGFGKGIITPPMAGSATMPGYPITMGICSANMAIIVFSVMIPGAESYCVSVTIFTAQLPYTLANLMKLSSFSVPRYVEYAHSGNSISS